MVAQANLGLMYMNGWGVPYDTDNAYWWLSEAAEKGSVKAINNLAILYLQGSGVPKNVPHAIKLLEKTADSDSPRAIVLLGRIYQEELRDDRKAFFWFHRGYEQGVLEATFRLALMYEKGEGVAMDLTKAVQLYHHLVELNSAFAGDAKRRLAALTK